MHQRPLFWLYLLLVISLPLQAQSLEGEYKVKNSANRQEFRLSVHPRGLIALERFDRVRYGVLRDQGGTLTIGLQPVPADHPVGFQATATAHYRITYRHPNVGLVFVGDDGSQFTAQRAGGRPQQPIPDAVKGQLLSQFAPMASPPSPPGVALAPGDFAGRWRRDHDDQLGLVLEFLADGGFRATTAHGSYLGRYRLLPRGDGQRGTSATMRLERFGQEAPVDIPIHGLLFGKHFFAVENQTEVRYTRVGDATLTPEEVALAERAFATPTTGPPQQQPPGRANDNAGPTDPQAGQLVGTWQVRQKGQVAVQLELAPHGGVRITVPGGQTQHHGLFAVRKGIYSLQMADGPAYQWRLIALQPRRHFVLDQRDTSWRGNVRYEYLRPTPLTPLETQRAFAASQGDRDAFQALVGRWQVTALDGGDLILDLAPHGGVRLHYSKAEVTLHGGFAVRGGRYHLDLFNGQSQAWPLVAAVPGQQFTLDQRDTDWGRLVVYRYQGPPRLNAAQTQLARQNAAARRAMSQQAELANLQMQMQMQQMANQMTMQNFNQGINTIRQFTHDNAQRSKGMAGAIADMYSTNPWVWEWRE
ncbi:MAG: hypothetical protein ACFCBW_02955 [Candidatus Competibacterales bacterium]